MLSNWKRQLPFHNHLIDGEGRTVKAALRIGDLDVIPSQIAGSKINSRPTNAQNVVALTSIRFEIEDSVVNIVNDDLAIDRPRIRQKAYYILRDKKLKNRWLEHISYKMSRIVLFKFC